MKELMIRALSGLVYVSVLGFSILYNPISFLLVFFILMLFCLFEFSRLIKTGFFFNSAIAVVFYIYTALKLLDRDYSFVQAILIALVFGTFIKILFLKKGTVRSFLGKQLLSVAYIALPFVLLIHFPFTNEGFRPEIVLYIFVIAWANDTFAYLIGKNFGKHKLLKRISPNKTVEGLIGGLSASYVTCYIIALYEPFFSIFQWFTIAGIIGGFGVLGDLIESMFKRQAKVKDAGNILPGHGGFLDRLDSVIFAVPFVYIYFILNSIL